MKQNLNILLVEDNPGDALLTEELLLDNEYFSFELNNSVSLTDAKNTIENNKFDIILLDLGLPDSEGLMALEEILEIEKATPIIVITGLKDEKKGQEAVKLGAQHYITKGNMDSYSLVQSILFSIERTEHLNQIKAREAELEELIAQKDRLISIISHDVRGPIGVVLNFLKLLHNKYDRLDQDVIQKHIQNCFHASQSTYQLIETLLEWAHTQSGRKQVVPKVINLRTLVANSINPLLEIANKKSIHIVDLTPENLKLFADPDMISTVIRNLVSNAIKFSHHKSLIQIDHAENNNKELAHLKVIDSGVGIKEDKLDIILDIGEGYSSHGTDDEKGTGFGLILCKELIEKNGGELWIESIEEKGTTINFTIPLRE